MRVYIFLLCILALNCVHCKDEDDELSELEEILSHLEFNEREHTDSEPSDSKTKTDSSESKPEPTGPEPTDHPEPTGPEPTDQPDLQMRTLSKLQQRMEKILSHMQRSKSSKSKAKTTAAPAKRSDNDLQLRTAPPAPPAPQLERRISHLQRSKVSKSPKSKAKTTAAPVKRSDTDMELRTVLLREFNLRKNKRAKNKPKTTAAPVKRSNRGDELSELEEILSHLKFSEREHTDTEPSSESTGSTSSESKSGPEPTGSTGSKSKPEPTGPEPTDHEPTDPEPTDPTDRELRRIEEILSHLEFSKRGDTESNTDSDESSKPESTGSPSVENTPEPNSAEPTDPTGGQRELKDWAQWRMMDLKSRVNKRDREQRGNNTESMESTESKESTESTETEETGSGEIELTTPTFLRKEEAVNFLKKAGGKRIDKTKKGRRGTALSEEMEKTDILSVLKRRMMDVQTRGMGGLDTRGSSVGGGEYEAHKRQITTPATLDGTNACLMPDPEMERLRQLVIVKIEEILPPTTPSTATTAPEIPAEDLATAVLFASDELLEELLKGVGSITVAEEIKVCANTIQSIGLMVNTVKDYIIPNIKETIFNIFAKLYLDGKISPDIASKAKENLDEFVKVLYGPAFKAIRKVNDLVEKKYGLDVEDIRKNLKKQEQIMTTQLPETPTYAVERIVLPLIGIFKTLIEKVPMEDLVNPTFCRDQIPVLTGHMQKVFIKISQDKEMMKETLECVLDLDTKTVTKLETLINSEKERKILQSPFETLHLFLKKMLDVAETGNPLDGPHLDLTTFFMKNRLKNIKQNIIVHDIKTKIAKELKNAASTVSPSVELDTELFELETFDSIPVLWPTVWYTISSEVGLGINRGECTKPELVATAGILKLTLKSLSTSHMWNLEYAVEKLPLHAIQLKMKVRDIVKEQLNKFVTETVGGIMKGLVMEIHAGEKAFNPAELIYLKLAVLTEKSEPIITFGDLLEKALRIIVSTFDRVQKNLVGAGKNQTTFLQPIDPIVIQQKFKMLKQSLSTTGTTLDPLINAINNEIEALIPTESRTCLEVMALKLEIATGVRTLFTNVQEMLMYDLVETLEDGTTACRAKDIITGALGYMMNDQLEIVKAKRHLYILSEL